MRRFLFLILIICLTVPVHAERALKRRSHNEPKVALVIGNGSYTNSPLKNPANDADDMARALKKLGFQVTKNINANQYQMRNSIRQFGRNLKKGGIGLFFFAGHGMQVKGINYLIPVGADIQEEDEVMDYAVDAGMVLRKMQSAGNRLNIVFLDACRNNPFARSFRNAQRGLAQMDAPAGSMISYATAPGKTAADGSGRNGVFTRNLLHQLKKCNNIELAQLMKKVGRGVQKETFKKQVPWVTSSITGDFYFSGTSQKIKKVITVPISPINLNAEEEFWTAIKNSKSIQDFKDYIVAYPHGRFKKIAELKIRKLIIPEKIPISKILFQENFVNNINGWNLWPSGPHYYTMFEDGTYVMQGNNVRNYVEFANKSIVRPQNFDVELTTVWKSGLNNQPYGLTLGTNPENRYNFSVSGNGWTLVGGYLNNVLIDPAPLPWKANTSLFGNGMISNKLKVEIRGSKATYYVNDIFIVTIMLQIPLNQLRVGLYVENRQKVAFDNLIITAK